MTGVTTAPYSSSPFDVPWQIGRRSTSLACGFAHTSWWPPRFCRLWDGPRCRHQSVVFSTRACSCRPRNRQFERRRRKAQMASGGPDRDGAVQEMLIVRGTAKEAALATSFATSPRPHLHIDPMTVVASNAGEPTVSSAPDAASDHFTVMANGTATQHLCTVIAPNTAETLGRHGCCSTSICSTTDSTEGILSWALSFLSQMKESSVDWQPSFRSAESTCGCARQKPRTGPHFNEGEPSHASGIASLCIQLHGGATT